MKPVHFAVGPDRVACGAKIPAFTNMVSAIPGRVTCRECKRTKNYKKESR